MCGRFSLALHQDIINGKLGVSMPDDYRPSYNIAPEQNAAIIMNTDTTKAEMVHWGLLTPWSKGYSMINARAETLAEKPTYKKLLESKRCVVISDGFYEWQKTEKTKQPFRIEPVKGKLFLFAGLWTETEEDGKKIKSFTIITTDPNDTMAKIHDRMPVILNEKSMRAWLAGEDTELKAAPDSTLHTYAISKLVNNPANNSPDILKAAERQGSLV